MEGSFELNDTRALGRYPPPLLSWLVPGAAGVALLMMIMLSR